jgi:hypothetical protein
VRLRQWEPAQAQAQEPVQAQQPLPQGWGREPGAAGVRWRRLAPGCRRRLQEDGGAHWRCARVVSSDAGAVPPPAPPLADSRPSSACPAP